ncbi:galactosylceramide sulfotransferase-like [Hyalella azteca]|uniref:Galactosylceramide sulfotransferase-like n=1 Tax=Hyalella azteca TaxID=294128 RepID=A0A979FRG7_HYAAZ|nr:galactosylceramide sulfotransferase-like [Hyalella azteca]
MITNSSCSPQRHIAFLKTHKCASSAVQNILLRYGEKHNLFFALPSHNYFGGGRFYVRKEMIDAQFENILGYDIYAIHSRWNITEMKRIMPNDTIFITIVREPLKQFVSLFDYTNMEAFYKMNLTTYVKTVHANDARMSGYIGYNQMTWDLGLPAGQFENMTAVQELVDEADKLFDLVMVTERMPESLMTNKEVVFDSPTEKLLRQRLAADYKLYSHFLHKLDDLVGLYGEEQMVQDIAEYNSMSLRKQELCDFKQVPHEIRQKVIGYQSQSGHPLCEDAARRELLYLDKLRLSQKTAVIKRLRDANKTIPNHFALNVGINIEHPNPL